MGRTRPLDGVFEALASETRRALLEQLLAGEATVSALTEAAGVSQPAVSQQLAVLEAAGLVTARAQGRFRYYRLRAEPLREVTRFLERYRKFWDRTFDRLGEVLDQENQR